MKETEMGKPIVIGDAGSAIIDGGGGSGGIRIDAGGRGYIPTWLTPQDRAGPPPKRKGWGG